MEPRHPGWGALAQALAPGARVTRLRRLAGAGMTDAYDVTLDAAPGRVVVKLYRDGDTTAPSEWSRLQFAQGVSVPVPEPITADLQSAWFGRPAIVMSRLRGRPDLTAKDVGSWVAALAQTLAELHRTEINSAEGAVTQPPQVETWSPPAGEGWPLTADAVSAIEARRSSLTSERVLTHGDFHPGNVLWQRGRISGVVDWSEARLDARWYDLAYCRTAVCLHHGADVADRLADAYTDIVGDSSDDLAVYDLMCVLTGRYYAEESLAADREQGHVPNYELSLAYLEEQLQRALARLDR